MLTLDARVQLATTTLLSTAFLLVLLFLLGLSSYWWVVYGMVFGSVAMMYVSLNHLASCNAPTLRLPWDASAPIPNSALKGWRIISGRWANGIIATRRIEHGPVLTLYGEVENNVTFLCFECLSSIEASPQLATMGVDFSTFASLSVARSAEE